MSRLLNDLEPVFAVRCFELIARCAEAGLPVMIINTKRTPAEQAAFVAKGVSWVSHSRHEDGLAIDVAPYQTYMLEGADKLNWDADDPAWQKIGEIGESLGLVWGGRWKRRDMGHFEAPEFKTRPA